MGIKLPKLSWNDSAAQAITVGLISAIERYDKNRPLYCYSFVLKDIKSGEFHHHVTGRAQQAICLFCNKAVVSWGRVPKSKRSGGHIKCRELEDVHRTHTPKCQPIWLRNLFYRYATGRLPSHFGSFFNTINTRFKCHNDHRWNNCERCWLDSVYLSIPTEPGTFESINIEILVDSFTKLKRES